MAPILGIAPLPVVAMPSGPFTARDKVPPIARFAGRRPAVWIDDQHTPEAHDWSATRTGPTLLIPIAPDLGLTRESVQSALDWAKRL